MERDAASRRVLVRFDAEITLSDEYDHLPSEMVGYDLLAQAVQDAIGHTGARVIDVTEYEEGAA